MFINRSVHTCVCVWGGKRQTELIFWKYKEVQVVTNVHFPLDVS